MVHWEMRKKDQEITDEEELRRILQEAHYVTLAMCHEGEPYLVTIRGQVQLIHEGLCGVLRVLQWHATHATRAIHH